MDWLVVSVFGVSEIGVLRGVPELLSPVLVSTVPTVDP